MQYMWYYQGLFACGCCFAFLADFFSNPFEWNLVEDMFGKTFFHLVFILPGSPFLMNNFVLYLKMLYMRYHRQEFLLIQTAFNKNTISLLKHNNHKNAGGASFQKIVILLTTYCHLLLAKVPIGNLQFTSFWYLWHHHNEYWIHSCDLAWSKAKGCLPPQTYSLLKIFFALA